MNRKKRDPDRLGDRVAGVHSKRALPVLTTTGSSVARRVPVNVDLQEVVWVAYRDSMDPILFNALGSMFWQIWPEHTIARDKELSDLAENLDPETVEFFEDLLEARKALDK